jgi:hypothetical protein
MFTDIKNVERFSSYTVIINSVGITGLGANSSDFESWE